MFMIFLTLLICFFYFFYLYVGEADWGSKDLDRPRRGPLRCSCWLEHQLLATHVGGR